MEAPLMEGNRYTSDMQQVTRGGGEYSSSINTRLGFIAGLIPHAKIGSFERILFR